MCLFKVLYLGHAMAFETKWDNFREIYQEFCLLECAVIYMMILTLENGSKASANVSQAIIIVAILDVLPALGQTVFDSIKFGILSLKKKYKLWSAKQKMKQRAKMTEKDHLE